MAQAVKRERRATGKRKVYSYRVRWRYEGKRDGDWQSVTVRDEQTAKSLRLAVEVRGHRVHDDDPDVLDMSIVTGERTRHRVVTFREVAEQYIASRTTATIGTRERYAGYIVRHLAHWADRPVTDITRTDVADLINDFTSRGRSPEIVYDFAKAVMNYAVTAEPPLRAGNPCAGVRCPRRRKRQNIPGALEPREADLVLRACGPEIALLVETVMATGLRQGEAFGLQVRDLDLEGASPVLKVRRAVRRPEGGVGATLGKPKSENSIRDNSIDTSLAETLAEHVRGKASTDFVFPNPATGDFWRASIFNKGHWYPALDRAAFMGLRRRPRFHDLRHTHGSWLATEGVPLLAISRRLGHDSIAITADLYGHVQEQTEDQVRAVLAAGRPRQGV